MSETSPISLLNLRLGPSAFRQLVMAQLFSGGRTGTTEPMLDDIESFVLDDYHGTKGRENRKAECTLNH